MAASRHEEYVAVVHSYGRGGGTITRRFMLQTVLLTWISSASATEDGSLADPAMSFSFLQVSAGPIYIWILGVLGILLLAGVFFCKSHMLRRIALKHNQCFRNGITHLNETLENQVIQRPDQLESVNRVTGGEVHDPQQAKTALQRQVDFNELITGFLTEFANSEPDALPDLVNNCLRRIALFCGVEAAAAVTISRDTTAWSCTYVWHASDASDYFSSYQDVPIGRLAWPEAQILRGDTILLSSLDDLPPEASDYRQHLEEKGVKSLIILPFRGQGGVITGCFTLISFLHETIWLSEEVQRLQLTSDVLASVLVRKRAEELNQKENARIQWLLRLHEQSDSMTDRDIFTSALEAAVSFTDSENGFLHVVNADQKTLASTLWSQETHKQCDLTQETHYPLDKAGMWAESVRLKQPLVLNNYHKRMGKKGFPEGHVPVIHLVTLPVLDGALIRLVVGVCNKRAPYDDHDVQQLQIIANELQKLMARRRGEEALRNSREQYALAVDGVNDGVWDWNLQTNALYLSSRWKSMLGYEKNDLPNQYETWESLLHPDDKARVLATLQMSLAKQVAVYEAEMRLRCKDGGYRWILARGKVLRDAVGTPYRMAGSHTDITERKQTEEEIRAERDYAQRILDTVETVIVSINRQGRITLINRKGCELLGYPEEELIGGKWFDQCLPQPKGREQDYPAFQAIMSGKSEGPNYSESEVLLRNGEQRLIAWRNTYLYGDQNQLVGVLQGGGDITERKRAEEALRASELKFRVVAEYTYDWEFWRAPDQTYLYISPSCERITGYTVDAFMADINLMEHIIYSGDKELWRNHFRTGNPTTELTHIEFRIVCADGSIRWISHECRSVFDGAGVYLGIRGSNRDITARRSAQERERIQREQALQANKLISLGTLVSGVAHEINNPNHIISFSASTIGRIWTDVQVFLEEIPLEDNYQLGGLDWKRVHESMPELLSSLRKASDRIKDIVEDLRAYARPDLERIEEEVDMGVVVHAAAAWLTHLIKKSTQRFSVNCEPGIPCVYGNRRRLEQVLVNLVLNACQSLPAPDRAIRVVVRQDVAAGHVIVEVVDEGVGMPEEVLEHVMDPFFTTKRDIGGTGLGLSIVFGIVNEHGGALVFESTVGAGTTARIILPASTKEEA